MKRFLPTLALMAVFLCSNAIAQTIDNDAKLLREVESYLNSLTTAKGTFLQSASRGGYATGNFFLSRPGKIRFDYNPPNNIMLMADGRDFIYYDKDLVQITYLSLDASIAGVLIKDKIDFSDKQFNVEDISENGGIIRLSISQSEDPLAGKLIMTFKRSPMQILKWQVIDAQNIATTVILEEMQYGIELDKSLFKFDNPRASSDFQRRRR